MVSGWQQLFDRQPTLVQVRRAAGDAMRDLTVRRWLIADELTLVYFIVAEDGPVKIGHSKDPWQRLRTMQIGSPVRLTLLDIMVGGAAEEHVIHRQFAHLRLHGEWFTDTPELREWIERECLGV